MKILTMYCIKSEEHAEGKFFDDYGAVFNRAYFTQNGAKEAITRMRKGFRIVDGCRVPVQVGSKIRKLMLSGVVYSSVSRPHKEVWVLFDTCNGSYNIKNGNAHIFIFKSRRLAREYKHYLNHLRLTDPNIITVDGPHKYKYLAD